ncbi:MAG TPA: UDP-N-acetylmuramoyl-L-alanyl-D-glutamate--2,6-diaminopimelate ligase [Rhodospirillales bacterium]|nr:UDP-N-acetylmuramoyl-L-alanyl-D-glutamate--2,6-diaminopimelate ligase [Rhodospirillales bacterium]HIO38914.1 UDP-N-acetylmuramoyl-L-alanyl-D-glutamate--2,6-diaminopimelate ligase [Rhodospirillales bacterium]
MQIAGSTDINIFGLTADSRLVEPGFLFAALEGGQTDGRKFIPEAVERGAIAILAPLGTKLDVYLGLQKSVSLISCDNPRLAYADISARFFAFQPKTVAAITGTNGKSSVADFVRQLWTLAGVPAASLGTLGLVTPSGSVSCNLTTPDPALLHDKLSRLVQDNINHLALEASSHGLAQYRLDGVRVPIAAFTNLSRDHLDYHSTLDNYFSAKARLFSDILSTDGTAILNGDDPCFEILRSTALDRGADVLSYGWQGKNICICDLWPEPSGQRLEFMINGARKSIRLPLIGDFQAMNILCALGIVLVAGGDCDVTVENLETLKGVSGRLEFVAKLSNGAAIYVDYAHTPDALKNVLTSMRSHTNKNLHVVFGCGGDRDPGKRAEMGAIATSFADKIIITDDNPRKENAASIRHQILESCDGALEIENREQAIFEAISRLKSGDLLVIAGKGHEQGQIFNSVTVPFSDAEVAKKAALNRNSCVTMS